MLLTLFTGMGVGVSGPAWPLGARPSSRLCSNPQGWRPGASQLTDITSLVKLQAAQTRLSCTDQDGQIHTHKKTRDSWGSLWGGQEPLRTQVPFYTKMEAWGMFRGVAWNEKSFCLLPSRSRWHLPQWEDHCAWSKHWNVAPWAGARPFGCPLHEVPAPESYCVRGDSGAPRARRPGGEECGGRCVWSSEGGACSCDNYRGGN